MRHRRPSFIRLALLACTTAATLLGAGRVCAQALVCGDVNESGDVTASDAQAVLKAAVGQNVDLVCDYCGSTCPGDPRYLLGQWYFQSLFDDTIYEDDYDLFAVDEVNCEIVGQDLNDLGIVFAYAGFDYDYVLLDPAETYCDLFLVDYVGPDEVEGYDVLLDVDVDGYCDFDAAYAEGPSIGDRIGSAAASVSAARNPMMFGPQPSKAAVRWTGLRTAENIEPRLAAVLEQVRQQYDRHRRK